MASHILLESRPSLSNSDEDVIDIGTKVLEKTKVVVITNVWVEKLQMVLTAWTRYEVQCHGTGKNLAP